MANLNYLYRSLEQYQGFRNETEKLIGELKLSIDSLELSQNYLADTYQYDGYSADNFEVKNSKNKLSNILTSLQNDILVAIDSKIRKLERQIADAEAREAMNLI